MAKKPPKTKSGIHLKGSANPTNQTKHKISEGPNCNSEEASEQRDPTKSPTGFAGKRLKWQREESEGNWINSAYNFYAKGKKNGEVDGGGGGREKKKENDSHPKE